MSQVTDTLPPNAGPAEKLQEMVDKISLLSAYLAAGCLGLLTLLTLG